MPQLIAKCTITGKNQPKPVCHLYLEIPISVSIIIRSHNILYPHPYAPQTGKKSPESKFYQVPPGSKSLRLCAFALDNPVQAQDMAAASSGMLAKKSVTLGCLALNVLFIRKIYLF